MTFRIQMHGRLQEWVADANGYFADEGLTDYTMGHVALTANTPGAPSGAYQSYEQGREASISCACHWTVNMAASNRHGRLYGNAYSVSPCGIFVPAGSPVRSLADLADTPVDVGYQSGSHYATIQALETALPAGRIKLEFAGRPDLRLARLDRGEAPAATLFGIQAYIAEQLGLRKIADCTFMIVGMAPEDVSSSDVAKYYAALRRAQHDIDLHHQRYTHFYLNEISDAYRDRVNVDAFGPGERIVFEPYSAEMYQQTHDWVEERGIFETDKIGRATYEEAASPLYDDEANVGEVAGRDGIATPGAFALRQVGHLLRRAYAIARRNSAEALSALGDVSPVQASVLSALTQGALTQAELGRRIGMEPANTHTLVRRMAAAGLIEMRRDPSNRRLTLAALTLQGATVAADLEGCMQAATARTLAALAPEEQASLLSMLSRVVLADATAAEGRTHE